MQELKLVAHASDQDSLVFVPIDGAGEECFVVVTDELRDVLAGKSVAPRIGGVDASPSNLDSSDEVTSGHVASDAARNASEPGVDGHASQNSIDGSAESTTPAAAEGAEQSAAEPSAPLLSAVSSDLPAAETATTSNPDSSTATGAAPVVAGEGKPAKPKRPRLQLRPKDIQRRIRQGKSVEDVAAEAGVSPHDIHAFVTPVLVERSGIAELARHARPFDDATAALSKRTLWDTLAVSFAARGDSVNETHWDAYQDEARQWIIAVSWNKASAGTSASHVAEFVFNPVQKRVDPHNPLAADLLDPRYGQPVRSITKIDFTEPTVSPFNSAPTNLPSPEQQGPGAPTQLRAASSADANQADSRTTASGTPSHSADGQDDPAAFRLEPTPTNGEDARPKRRRKAVAPNWEDVLLGVRPNPKKK